MVAPRHQPRQQRSSPSVIVASMSVHVFRYRFTSSCTHRRGQWSFFFHRGGEAVQILEATSSLLRLLGLGSSLLRDRTFLMLHSKPFDQGSLMFLAGDVGGKGHRKNLLSV
ncbi:hypothetical protein YC2023_115987 [Brassica napus]